VKDIIAINRQVHKGLTNSFPFEKGTLFSIIAKGFCSNPKTLVSVLEAELNAYIVSSYLICAAY
jgi:hypothetical protein